MYNDKKIDIPIILKCYSINNNSNLMANNNKIIYIICWCILCAYIFVAIFPSMFMPTVTPLSFAGIMIGMNSTDNISNFTVFREYPYMDMLEKTCQMWNKLPNTNDKIIQYQLINVPRWCVVSPDYTKHVADIFIFTMVNLILLILIVIMFIYAMTHFHVISKLGICIFLSLLVASTCVNIYMLQNENSVHLFTSGEVYDIKSIIKVEGLTLHINNQFAFTRSMCDMWQYTRTNYVNVSFDECNKKNIQVKNPSIIINLVAFVISTLLIIHVWLVDTDKKSAPYVEIL
jgi:hypothetical protein